MLEQFLNVVPENIRATVCEREPDSVLRAAEIVDTYTQNRVREGYKPHGKNNHYSPQFKRKKELKNKPNPNAEEEAHGSPEQRNSYSKGR